MKCSPNEHVRIQPRCTAFQALLGLFLTCGAICWPAIATSEEIVSTNPLSADEARELLNRHDASDHDLILIATDLTEEAAEVLAGYKSGVEPDDVIKQVVDPTLWPQGSLLLTLGNLSTEAAKQLAQRKDNDVLSIAVTQDVPQAVRDQFGKSRRLFDLKTPLSDDEMRLQLAKQKSDKSIRFVATELSADVADALAKRTGPVFLTLGNLSVAVAKQLARHRGSLYIELTRDVPEAVSDALQNTEGKITLRTPHSSFTSTSGSYRSRPEFAGDGNVDMNESPSATPSQPSTHPSQAIKRDGAARPSVAKQPTPAVVPNQPADAVVRDNAVALAIGDTLQKYQQRGFKDVELGVTFDALHKAKPFTHTDRDREWVLHNSQHGNDDFIFNDHNVLVSYTKSYNGGTDDYLDQIIAIFGKTAKDPYTRTLRQPSYIQHSSIVDYTFPKVFVQVKFVDNINNAGKSSYMHVFVTDRGWAERVLNEIAASKRHCLHWMKAAMTQASSRDWAVASVPILPGTTAKATESERLKICLYDDQRLNRLVRLSKKSDNAGTAPQIRDENILLDARCGWYGLELLPPGVLLPAVVFDFNKRDAIDRAHPLRRGVDNSPLTDGEFGFWSAAHRTPCLRDLSTTMTVNLVQEFFPPRTDKINVTRATDNPYTPDKYEWETDLPSGRWVVRYFTDDRVTLTRTEAKKL